MIKCTYFNPYEKGALKGFATLFIEKWQFEIMDCKLYEKDGRRWISFPMKEFKDKNGDVKYKPYVRFIDKGMMNEFIRQALDAIDEYKKGHTVFNDYI